MLLTAYFDESNTSPNQKTPIVAGYLGSKFQWSRFDEQWAKLLRTHKVPIDPTYKQRIAHRSKMHPKNKLFSAWAATHLDNFLEDAAPLIRRHIRVPIGNAVFRSDFEEIIPENFRKGIGGAYGWCVYASLYAIRQWCNKNNYNKPIGYVFENGALGSQQVRKWFEAMRVHPQRRKEFRLGPISFADKRVRPLQAADFLVYELGKFALDTNLGRTRENVTKALLHLLGPTPPKDYKVIFWDRPKLQSIAENASAVGLFVSESQ